MRFRAVRRALTGVAVVFAAAACGASSYTYVANSDDGAFARLPAAWTQVDEGELAAAIGVAPGSEPEEQGIWLQGYDAAERPSVGHVLGASAEHPAVLVLVQQIPEELRGQYSLDRLRDLFQPVSPAAREQLAANPVAPLAGFQLLRDEVLTPGDGLRGVHVTYSYRINGGVPQVFDQVAYLNDDASTVYLLVARCSSSCFEQRRGEIESVVSTFTVRERP